MSREPADLAFSPDGNRIAYIATESDSGQSRLWVRALAEPSARPFPETETAERPFWSPDGRSIAFFTRGDHPRLKKVPADGGSPVTLCEVTWARGGTWGKNGDIVFAPAPLGPLCRVSAAGGEVSVVTSLDTTRHETGHRMPTFLPDGDHFVYASLPVSPQGWDLFVGSLHSKQAKKLTTAASGATYADPGFLLFERESKLVAQRLDLRRLEVVGEAEPLADAPAPDWTQEDATRIASASRNGRLVALRRAGQRTHLEWFDRSGVSRGRPSLPPSDYSDVSLSPDGRSAALSHRVSSFASEVLRVDLERGVTARLTDAKAWNAAPRWSPDGNTVAINSSRSGREEIYLVPSDGSGEPRLVPTTESQFKNPVAWSPDGKKLVINSIGTQTGLDLYVVSLDGDHAVRPLAVGAGAEYMATVSPDGRWIAYGSDETGRFELFVRSFPEGKQKLQLTTTGGAFPHWSRDGREIVYTGGEDFRGHFALHLEGGATPRPGATQLLFRWPHVPTGADISKDDERILAALPDADPPEPVVTVILDWTSMLGKR
jgi:Tol biopolymer transport system component